MRRQKESGRCCRAVLRGGVRTVPPVTNSRPVLPAFVVRPPNSVVEQGSVEGRPKVLRMVQRAATCRARSRNTDLGKCLPKPVPVPAIGEREVMQTMLADLP